MASNHCHQNENRGLTFVRKSGTTKDIERAQWGGCHGITGEKLGRNWKIVQSPERVRVQNEKSEAGEGSDWRIFNRNGTGKELKSL
jgi:hypothetical protein